ncbi:hypothetical protein AVEN_253816-1 [Araneus ventricosus]|uniref:Integrase catalytic domain-containing protein n=1 Tax=Araneus ventricosus TaxID=182803 RepID=A0A4Y2TH73_ARAVE|nr:hypothetical protein AVEN_250014-1 [Araneus ventricosus]GBN98451.1 hypothetical protein AVEN_30500-1 [Araneus ventricosus]GBN98455.1 hypothetical protein AVEN_157952-1 [Araneus ventricosus]GBN98460.1 hypothetical protein AVEN_253816-1 [Araneus ventricosus]
MICGFIPRIENKEVLNELKRKKIHFTDSFRNETEINLLIGADVLGKLLTGNIDELESGLTAVETKLGWTVFGKDSYKKDNILPTLSMHSMNVPINKLWQLEVLGISSPTETEKEKGDLDLNDFNDKMKILPDGRYEVELQWKYDSKNLPFKVKSMSSEPTPLPPDRVTDCAPFEIVGIDLAGPLFLKNEEKVWIVLFTCAVYRAIHLELVNSLTSDAFLLALRRFISRRGRPRTIYCDNGTNFRGASNVLSKLNWSKVPKETRTPKIFWKFIPPTAAWWGGWWERLVRTLKNLLKRTLGKSVLTSNELYTAICDCESNSHDVSDNVNKLAPADDVIMRKYSSSERYVKAPKRLDLLNNVCYVLETLSENQGGGRML